MPQDPILKNIYEQYPAFKAMGAVVIKADTNFTRENTGVGDIEYFSPNQDTIRYNTGYKYAHPSKGSHGILYNPKTNDQQSIMLDMLHGMKDADPQYAKIRNEFKSAIINKFKGDLEEEWKDYAKENPENDGKQQFTENWIDGHIRGLMFEGTSADFQKHNYWEGERGLYLQDNNIANSFNKLVNHLKTEQEDTRPMPSKHKVLYDQLKSEGFYTKSYDEFVRQFANPEKIVKLHSLMQEDGLYTRSADDFKKQFFRDIQPQKKIDYSVIPVKDVREIDMVTQEKVADTNRLHVNIDPGQAKHIVKKAKEYGIDPYTALAMAYQETGFKDEYKDNPFNLLSGGRFNPETANADLVDLSMQTMLDKRKIAESLGKKTEEEVIQAWNGYGKISNTSFGGTVKKVYGIDVSENAIDMGKDPIYGRRVIDIRDNILKQNPDIIKLVKEI